MPVPSLSIDTRLPALPFPNWFPRSSLHLFKVGFDGFLDIVSVLSKHGNADGFVSPRDRLHLGDSRPLEFFPGGRPP